MRCGQSRKRDANEGEIVQALRKMGATVIPISGKDAPDLLVKYREVWLPIEVKSGKGKVTAGQAFIGYPIVQTVDAALALLRSTVGRTKASHE